MREDVVVFLIAIYPTAIQSFFQKIYAVLLLTSSNAFR
ncbi:hypothetical protein SpAn4DRAFT_1891 [Sporomusa ovata]|uniref:Uncharacterized protein n=1 Tax=Sporomusa ovata TaxID=2378 RepID=A0A0U1KVH9_9FIRM|nr:hypothetical protein SpAn4DRAFT_1891 [Sporomusa ovata]